MQKMLKDRKGSISLFVLLSALFFLVIVTGVAVGLKNRETSIDSQIAKVKATYEKDVGNEEGVYNAKIFPEEYKKVEYIESTGTQYIDTGYIPKANTKLELTLSFSGTFSPLNYNTYIFFSVANKNDDFFGMNFGGGSGQGNVLFVWADKSYQVTGPGTEEAFSVDDYNIITSKNTIIMQNGSVTYGGYGRTITSKSRDQSTSMILFGFSNYTDEPIGDEAGPIPISAYNMKVYGLKLYENDVLVRDYVPCYRVSDNEIGLYERVNEVFYPNDGTGTFNKGNDVSTL